MVFSLVFLALSVGTSSLTHFLLPKWLETFLTSTDVALNKMKSFPPKDHVIPLLNPSNKPCCFRAVWLSKPINCFLFSFTCSWHAGLSLGTELYLGAPETKLSALPYSFPAFSFLPLPQTLLCHSGSSNSTHSFRFNSNPISFGNSWTFPSQNSSYLCRHLALAPHPLGNCLCFVFIVLCLNSCHRSL